MRLALVFGVIGHFTRLFAWAFLLPLGVASWEWWHGRTHVWSPIAFAVALVVTLTVGTLFSRSFRSTPSLRRSEALGVVAGTWFCVALCAAIPYLFFGLSVVNAFFESMSGLTTTGATILTDFSAYDKAFYLWRGMTQWFGGLGVIALFVVVLPRLGIAGRQLFFAEASTASGDAVSPQIRESARRLWVLYIVLTATEAGILMSTGLSLYEAVVHSFTTMSAGGFSPNPESIQGYHNPSAEWVFVIFMVLAGTSFTLQYRTFTKNPFAFLRDREFMTYFLVMLLLAVVVGMMLVGGVPDEDSLRAGAFQVASLASSTGYASTDFNLWSNELKAVLLLAMVFGGCAGSACGGAKVVRYILTAQWLRRELTQVLHPRAVIPIRYGNSVVPGQIMRAVTTLVFLFIIGYALTGFALVVMEPDMDLVTGFSASLACLGNIGPAFGDAGPMGSYAFFGDWSKILLAFSMWIGRLEIVTVIALLHPHVWRHLHWRGGAQT